MFFERYKHTFLPLIRHHISNVIFLTSYFHFLTRCVIMSLLFVLFPSYVIFPTRSIVLSFCRSVVLFYLMFPSYVIFATRSIVLSFYRSVVLFYLICPFLRYISDSSYLSVILLFCRSIILSFYGSVILSFYRSIVLSFYRSVVLFYLMCPSYIIFPTRSLLFCPSYFWLVLCCSVVLSFYFRQFRSHVSRC